MKYFKNSFILLTFLYFIVSMNTFEFDIIADSFNNSDCSGSPLYSEKHKANFCNSTTYTSPDLNETIVTNFLVGFLSTECRFVVFQDAQCTKRFDILNDTIFKNAECIPMFGVHVRVRWVSPVDILFFIGCAIAAVVVVGVIIFFVVKSRSSYETIDK